jgi:uncharacterized protein
VIVVSDASPLIGLAVVQQIDLLRHLYGEVLIPDAVHREVVILAADAPGASEVSASSWIRVRRVEDRALVEALAAQLGSGEAEAIALAVEVAADIVLIDERRARAVATRLGRRVVGVLGVLVEAKARGHLLAVRPVLEALTIRAGFRVSPALFAREAAGEAQ